ncbi:hypothetical protein ACFOU2_09790 [Bacillus songklensis]|uniref:Uncharacterized protein n=1 Tax=Bacillus songklensis TaxID=1069116 RepID=A0ABV8B3J4_9BACI
MSKKKNPVIEKARQEGFLAGQKVGFEHGKHTALYTFASKFEGLEKVKGIGPKTMELIVRHFGKEYFESEGKEG